VVNALRQQQVPLLRLLDSVPDWTMNGRVWLLALDAQPGKAVRRGGQAPGLSVSLFGAALSRGAFADYYDFMGDQPMVNELTLDTPPLEAELRGVKVVQFKLAFSVPDLP
jgi:hypothetical protein